MYGAYTRTEGERKEETNGRRVTDALFCFKADRYARREPLTFGSFVVDRPTDDYESSSEIKSVPLRDRLRKRFTFSSFTTDSLGSENALTRRPSHAKDAFGPRCFFFFSSSVERK